jgi:bifunctional DNA-binding transcriptional regulator/antitoxin component of YhaV-PrlF toxin-antitoxin module
VTRVSPKHQVTLPVDALRAAGLETGDELTVTIDESGRVILTPVRDHLEELIGSGPAFATQAELQRMRDEWER